MTRLNVAEGKPYISQRDNKIRPYITCNSTSMVMALYYNGFTFPLETERPETQPEDALTYFILSDYRVSKFYKDLDEKSWKEWQNNMDAPAKCTPPNEHHVVLAYATNLWMRKEVDTFSIKSIQEILFYMIQNYACVVQTGEWSGMKHITCMSGFESFQNDILSVSKPQDIDLDKMDNIIMQDPWGDYRTGYKDINGKDILVPYLAYKAQTRNSNDVQKKLVHLIKKNPSL